MLFSKCIKTVACVLVCACVIACWYVNGEGWLQYDTACLHVCTSKRFYWFFPGMKVVSLHIICKVDYITSLPKKLTFLLLSKQQSKQSLQSLQCCQKYCCVLWKQLVAANNKTYLWKKNNLNSDKARFLNDAYNLFYLTCMIDHMPNFLCA